jgi:hypothetical protein
MALIHHRLLPAPTKQGGFARELALLEMLREACSAAKVCC